MQNYPSREVIVDVLLAAARLSVAANPPHHPEDFAVTMMNAIETTAPVLMYMNEKGYLK